MSLPTTLLKLVGKSLYIPPTADAWKNHIYDMRSPTALRDGEAKFRTSQEHIEGSVCVDTIDRYFVLSFFCL